MDCVILCGGKGTRLSEQTKTIPKPLVKVGGMPILWHIMKHYSKFGIKRFILCLGYKGHKIKEFFMNDYWKMNDIVYDFKNDKVKSCNVKGEDWEIIFAETGEDDMTGARIKHIESYIKGDDFCLTYGDGVSDINMSKLIKFHKDHGKIGTVTAVSPRARFGSLKLNEDCRVDKFEKKELYVNGWIDGGFFVFNKKIMEYLSDNPECMLEKEPLQRLSKEGEFMAYLHSGFWQCMDTQKDVDTLNEVYK